MVVYFKAYVLPVAVVAVLAPMGLFTLPRSSGDGATSAPLLEERCRGPGRDLEQAIRQGYIYDIYI